MVDGAFITFNYASNLARPGRFVYGDDVTNIHAKMSSWGEQELTEMRLPA